MTAERLSGLFKQVAIAMGRHPPCALKMRLMDKLGVRRRGGNVQVKYDGCNFAPVGSFYIGIK